MSLALDPVIIGITQRRGPASREEMERREAAATKLANLGHINPEAGQVAHSHTVGWQVSICGQQVPILALGYEIVPDEDGPVVTLSFPADQVHVDNGTTSPPATPETSREQVSQEALADALAALNPRKPKRPWGPADKDPRANIPGWTPEDTAVADV